MASSRCRHPLELFDTLYVESVQETFRGTCRHVEESKKVPIPSFLGIFEIFITEKIIQNDIDNNVVAEVKCVPDHERCHCDIEPAGFKVKGIVNNLQKVTATSFN